MKHKKLFISITAVCSVIVFFAVFLMIWFFGDTYPDFEAPAFRQEVEIPGLADGAVPQGIATCPAEYYVERVEITADGEEKKITEAKTQQYFFVSAYMNDGSPSRIYVTGEDTGYVGYVTMKTETGEDFYGHCGGIAINNTTSPISTTSSKYYTLWVTGEGMVYCAKASDEFIKQKKSIAMEIIEKASRKAPANNEGDIAEDYYTIQFTSSFEANNRASFCFYYDDPTSSSVSSDKLFVGEFYREENYKTDDMHKLTTPNGYKNNAFMYEYNVTSSDSNKYGLYLIDKVDGIEENARVPKIQKIYSIPEKIQGGSFSGKSSYSTNNGILVLSQSYGLSNSHLLCFDVKTLMNNSKKYTEVTGESFKYKNVKKTFGGETIDYTDPNIYVYYADKNDEEMFVNDYSIPSMSEGLCVVTPSTSGNSASNRIHVLFESAGKKYRTFVRQQTKNVYSFIPKIG